MVEGANSDKRNITSKAKSRRKKIEDPIQKELDSIKRLFALLLIKAGTPQAEIAIAMDIDQGDLSRILPARKFKQFNKT